MSFVRRAASLSPKFVRFMSEFERQQRLPIIKKYDAVPPAVYGGRFNVTMIPGMGIGPECMQAVKDIFKFACVPVDFEEMSMDPDATDNEDLDNAVTSIKRNGLAIKGNIEVTSTDPEVRLRNVAIRNDLELFAYVIRCKSYPNVRAKHANIDSVVIRQNIGEVYSMLEHSTDTTDNHQIVESLKVNEASAIEKLAHYSYQFAVRHKRKKITIIHKANAMPLTDGIFLEGCREVGKQYPAVETDDRIVDDAALELVSHPERFDVMLCLNLYGNVIANMLCGMCGGPGLFSGKNYGDHYSVFEPGTRNAGKTLKENTANPICMINAAINMLFYLGLDDHGRLIAEAVQKTICVDKIHTSDLGGTHGTKDVVNKVLENISQNMTMINY